MTFPSAVLNNPFYQRSMFPWDLKTAHAEKPFKHKPHPFPWRFIGFDVYVGSYLIISRRLAIAYGKFSLRNHIGLIIFYIR
ncbi:MAG: hypothetical protein A2487_18280 [Candidatus Raymondbacteria bacterium RifOxyC12_full_50_8]|uniref:Uncharacterized protein n=1 Tax=Candidatus Raymondbacteria bacterium RIFOXYD12_FULL_49_13 TaxID=1817890 RepID=A0A1F7F5L8_UNCRA|nr:MAG: hypothetical protein A2350_08320 [Candidatus Raymondbacteria bacterium RifOxyB12_full_50_8]OGJ87170.1 MAG: hypothetical protein A2248_04005 [Candidatus Raymondbacteria bacterium RIFOXYA2_FULL_49_16]OGJ95349.1 MAG: hypothetical protein A2487_18280 [Candidatus Raymondbacteria bacterium RifOxyC12_full_50_8]OGK01827.1 MAG: hypothetical protein A2519_03120 [Candidatus Raymondbacteria bacterium RIFOXYD12_FULL_49_13]OGP41166.1 MAG: hypothetical protein A2324_08650 [Candidatus Raymondbacteria b